MIRRVEALGYRCLRYCRQDLGAFQVLVGPNASGKSTFLDVLALLRDLVNKGGEKEGLEAVRARGPGFSELLWMGNGTRFELAIEMDIPADRATRLPRNGVHAVRYEIAIGLDERRELAILGENLVLLRGSVPAAPRQLTVFPDPDAPPATMLHQPGRHWPKEWKPIITKSAEGQHTFLAETSGWNQPFKLRPQALGLANLPDDEGKFPIATWFKHVLRDGVQKIALNSDRMRLPSPPGSPSDFQPDGSNLPRAVEALRAADPERLARWIAHVRTALPDIKAIATHERPEDKHRYLTVEYRTGLHAPSWTVSDGTLRLLALTLLAYVGTPDRIYLVEEPENGIHPQAVETIFKSLSSAYDAQILCATHSPVLMSLASPEQVLCFARNKDGATDIVRGDEHPNLRDWQGDVDLGTLFATGMLG